PNVWGEQFRRGSEVLEHPQSIWNEMVLEKDDRDVGRLRSPGPIARMDATPAQIDRPPPRLGEHDAAIRTEAANAKPPEEKGNIATAPRNAKPLEGVTVVELGTYYAAPYGATLLAELGARVIKLEQLDGDPQRIMLPFPELAGMKALQGKESVAIDLSSEQGRAIAYRVIEDCDIILQSFRAGAAARLKLDAETIAKINPNVIYLASPGYGEDGPCGHRPAFAPTIGAAAGLAWRQAGTLVPHGPDLPLEMVKPAAMQLAAAVMGVGNADGTSAVTAATGMMLGLVARNRGAGGQHLLSTMLSSVSHLISEVTVEYEGRPAPATAGEDLYGFNALYRLYPTADEWVFLAAPSDREWRRLTQALPGGARLASDERFSTRESRVRNDAALGSEIGAILVTRTGAEWERDLRAADVACVVAAQAPVESHYMDEGDVGAQCQLVVQARHPILDEIPRLAPLVRFSRSGTVAGDAGLCGQHTNKVLSDYGYSDAELATLASDNIIMQN
ncbi:MAG: CoA transferase, partial [Caulobacterales bacterium]